MILPHASWHDTRRVMVHLGMPFAPLPRVWTRLPLYKCIQFVLNSNSIEIFDLCAAAPFLVPLLHILRQGVPNLGANVVGGLKPPFFTIRPILVGFKE